MWETRFSCSFAWKLRKPIIAVKKWNIVHAVWSRAGILSLKNPEKPYVRYTPGTLFYVVVGRKEAVETILPECTSRMQEIYHDTKEGNGQMKSFDATPLLEGMLS